MKLTQAILPVAGLGTRFLPWTKVVPKELLPIGNQPIIALIVDECLSVGITDICFVISRGKEMIPQYFYDMPALEHELEARGKKHLLSELARYHSVNFHVAYQEEMKGDGHAILHAADWVKSDAVAILFGDDLIAGKKSGLEQLAEAWEALKPKSASAMLCLDDVARELVSRYGIVDIDESWQGTSGHLSKIRKVKGLVEKPKPADAPSTLGIVGKYIIPRSIFAKLRSIEKGSKDGEVRLIDALIAAKDSVDIYGCIVEGTRLDTGHPEGYKEAVKMLG
jgi:UTP--glucose-1-phosphate uridylyltransferase